MAANHQSPVELLLEHLNIAERSINLNYLQSRQILDNSLRLIGEVKSELRKHLECHYTTNTDNPKYTLMPLDKLTETLTLLGATYFSPLKERGWGGQSLPPLVK